VTTALRELLDAREQRGIATYGRSLTTHNGRVSPQDLVEELIDGAQYALQWELERSDLLEDISRLKRALDAVRSNAERIRDEARAAAEAYLAERVALKEQLAWCRARLAPKLGPLGPPLWAQRHQAPMVTEMPDAQPVTLNEVLGMDVDESLKRLKGKIDAAMAAGGADVSHVPSDDLAPRCQRCGCEERHLEPDECESCGDLQMCCRICQHTDSFTTDGLCRRCFEISP
jgi:hypothetical protein